jgi:hypothetical protein
MSLPSSATQTLTIDVRARRAERVLGVLASLGLAGAGMLLIPTFSFISAASCAVVTAAVIAGLWLHGWLGGTRRWARIARLPDGRWQLRDARHTDVSAELRSDSRVGARWVWLRWNAESAWPRHPSMLLIHGDIPTADLRRLIVRLRLEACPQTAAEPPVHDVF